MQAQIRSVVFLASVFALSAYVANAAESPDFLTTVGIVDKVEKETLFVTTGDKAKKTVELKITGTSKFHQLAPQVRSGKTVITQRTAESSDLVKGQSIAVIFTVADQENILLTAVIKAVEKEKK